MTPTHRILIVEDNDDTRISLRVLLERWGYQVQEAGDGHEGIQKALDWKPQAAVVDIGLPVRDGYQVARRVKQALGDHIVLIALTAYGSAEDRYQAFRAGFSCHLTKPADPQDLRRLLQACT